jgi:predicted small metal-binding protein
LAQEEGFNRKLKSLEEEKQRLFEQARNEEGRTKEYENVLNNLKGEIEQ